MTGPAVRLILLCCVAVPVAALAGAIPKGYVLRDSPQYQAAITGSGEAPVLNHLPYKIEPASDLLDQEPKLWGVDGKSKPRLCKLVPEAKAAVVALLAEVNAKPLSDKRKLFAFSCNRTIEYQKDTFCSSPDGQPQFCKEPVDRALSSAPPGYSEHATGYTLDFTTCETVGPDNTPRNCADLTVKFAETSAGMWLMQLAGKHGFELSFPKQKTGKNAAGKTIDLSNQGVSYEPWHWRWVGTSIDDPAKVAAARAIFARARKCFPANPGIPVDATEAPIMDTIAC